LLKKLEKQFKEHVVVLGAEETDIELDSDVQSDDHEQAVDEEVKVEVGKFDRKAVLSSYYKSDLCGSQGEFLKSTTWPLPSDLEAKSDSTLRSLRLKKVEWTMTNGMIFSFRITLSDGSVSHQVG